MAEQMAATQPASLWQQHDFLKLWAGQTVSMLGSQVSFLALPSTAVLTLGADAWQMGLLTMVGAAPALLFGLIVGAWADRLRRRPILIVADCGRFALLACIPLAYLLGVLRIELLFVLAFLVGTLSILFNTATGAYFPALVGPDHLVDGNSKLALSESVSEIAGPGLAGVLIQILSAPLAILADALTFLVSALSLAAIEQREAAPAPGAQVRHLAREIREGVGFVLGQPVLRTLLGSYVTLTLFNAMLEAVMLLFITRDAGIAPALFGFAFAVGSVGSVLGATLAARITRRVGVGGALLLAPLVLGASDLLVPLLPIAPPAAAPALLSVAQFYFGLARPLFGVNQASLRQAITPGPLRGRSSAANGVIAAGAAPILGAFLGGLLGQHLGAQITLVIAGAGEMLACLWIVFSPVRTLRTVGAPAADG